jgi:hypothetical protein
MWDLRGVRPEFDTQARHMRPQIHSRFILVERTQFDLSGPTVQVPASCVTTVGGGRSPDRQRSLAVGQLKRETVQTPQLEFPHTLCKACQSYCLKRFADSFHRSHSCKHAIIISYDSHDAARGFLCVLPVGACPAGLGPRGREWRGQLLRRQCFWKMLQRNGL